MFRDHVDWLLPQLESRIARAQPPLAGNLRQVAYFIEKLLKELALGYSRVVLRVPRAWLSLGFKGQLHVPLTRAMDFHARRLQLSQRLYARNPGGVWSELHQLYQRRARLGHRRARDRRPADLAPAGLPRRAAARVRAADEADARRLPAGAGVPRRQRRPRRHCRRRQGRRPAVRVRDRSAPRPAGRRVRQARRRGLRRTARSCCSRTGWSSGCKPSSRSSTTASPRPRSGCPRSRPGSPTRS